MEAWKARTIVKIAQLSPEQRMERMCKILKDKTQGQSVNSKVSYLVTFCGIPFVEVMEAMNRINTGVEWMEQIAVCVKCNTEAELEEATIENWEGTEEGVKQTTYYVEVTEWCQAGYDVVDKRRDEEQGEDDHQDYLEVVEEEERNVIYEGWAYGCDEQRVETYVKNGV